MNYIEIKNHVRGLIGAIRGHRSENEGFDILKHFLFKKREILLEIRSTANPEDYIEVYDWVLDQFQTQVPSWMNEAPTDFLQLMGVVPGASISLNDEIRWATVRLVNSAQTINRFRRLAETFEDRLLVSDVSGAERVLNEMRTKIGYSYWYVETGIGFYQDKYGLERQKKFSDEIKAIGRNSILSYAAHNISVRNEPNSTIGAFEESIIPKITRLSSINPETKQFLLHLVAGYIPRTSDKMAMLLLASNSHSIVDLFETFMAIVQSIAVHSRDRKLRDLALRSLQQLDKIQDFRIAKALMHLGDTSMIASCEVTVVDTYNALMKGDLKGAYRLSMSAAGADVSQLVAGSVALALQQKLRTSLGEKGHRLRVRQLAHVFSKKVGYYEVGSAVHKHFVNYATLPFARALGALTHPSEAIGRAVPTSEVLHHISLNNRYFGVEDAFVLGEIGNITAQLSSEQKLLIDDFERMKNRQVSGALPLAMDTISVLTNGNSSDDASNLEHVDQLKASGVTSLKTLASLKAIELYVAHNKLGPAIELVVDVILRRPDLSYALNLGEIFSTLEWNDLKPMVGRISLPVFLDIYWKQTGNEEVATLLRFSFDEFLDATGVSRPSELGRKSDKFDRDKLVYFLQNVCIKSIMDMNMNFSSSKDIEDERVAVSVLLAKLDPQNSEDYQAEIFSINHAQMIQKGIRLVDSSRIHVDQDVISNWVARNLRESYRRYRDLLNAGIGVAEDLDEVLRSLTKRRASTVGELLVPENEADDLLVRMVVAIRERFLFDPSYGLDSYLSKRIRHGSLLHHMRRPVEADELITHRSSVDGKYEGNTVWVNRLESLTQDERAQANKIFADFSRRFDGIALELKDHLLHVQSPDSPKGMLAVDLSKEAYELLRAALRDDEEIDGLIQGTFAIIWGLLQHSLDNIRTHLRSKTKREISETFSRLRHSLSKLADGDPEFGALSTAIGRASAAAQAQIDTVSGWFVQPRAQEGTVYTFEEAISICVESSIRSFGAFTPKVDLQISDQISMEAADLVKMHEVVWVMVQNVHDHCSLPNAPLIVLSGHYDEPNETISIRCENEVPPGSHTVSKKSELNEIRQSLSDGSYREKLRAEGKSGFRKVADLVHQSKKGSLNFGFTEDNKFFVEVRLSFVSFSDLNIGAEKAGGPDARTVG